MQDLSPLSIGQTAPSHVLTLDSLAELEALRKVLSLSHMIPADAYSDRGLNQEKIESHAQNIFMKLEAAFGGFSTFAEEED